MIKEIIYIMVLVVVLYLIYTRIVESKKYNKRLTIYKDVGGQSITEIEFKVKEEQLPVDPDDLKNCAWFLVTKKIKGRNLIWPRPPYEHWISENHCVIYSKSYKGNNYACLIDKEPFIDKIKRIKNSTEKPPFEYAILDSHDNLDKAKYIQTKDGDGFVTIETATEYRCVIFPRESHKVKPLFDERLLPEMVSLHTTMNQIYNYASWWDKNWHKLLIMSIIGMVMINSILNYKTLDEVKNGPIKHDMTIHVEGGGLTYENVEEVVEQPPDTPPPGGKFANIIRDRNS